MLNHYKTLGVTDFASIEEIKKAYRKLSKKFHPDVNDGDSFFEERFKDIQNAYECLSDTQKRRVYDEKLKQILGILNGEYSHYYSKQDYSRKNENNTTSNSTNSNNGEKNTSKENQQNNKETSHKSGTNNKKPVESTSFNFDPSSIKYAAKLFLAIPLCIIIALFILVGLSKLVQESNTANVSVQSDYSTTATISNESTNSPAELLNYDESSSALKALGDDYYNSDSYIENSPLSAYGGAITSPVYEVDASFFTIGSSKEEVLMIQGTPTGIDVYEALQEENWKYGVNWITFKRGVVKEFANRDGKLKVVMKVNGLNNSNSGFTIGSSKEEVLMIQGTPTGIDVYEALQEENWKYGVNWITFKRGVVKEFANRDGKLKVGM